MASTPALPLPGPRNPRWHFWTFASALSGAPGSLSMETMPETARTKLVGRILDGSPEPKMEIPVQPGEKVIVPARAAWSIGFLVGALAAAIVEEPWGRGVGSALWGLIARGVSGALVGAIVGRVMWRPAAGQVLVIKASEGLRPLIRTGAFVGLIIGTVIGLVNARSGALAFGTITGAVVGLALGMMSGALVWRIIRS
jgi:hypothetical protein